MRLSRQAFLLFTLNFLDAVFTLFLVHNDYAFEGNQLMAVVLDFGYATFLLVKIGVGALAAIIISRWGNLPVAKYGLSFALTIYAGVMGIHFSPDFRRSAFCPTHQFTNSPPYRKNIVAFFV